MKHKSVLERVKLYFFFTAVIISALALTFIYSSAETANIKEFCIYNYSESETDLTLTNGAVISWDGECVFLETANGYLAYCLEPGVKIKSVAQGKPIYVQGYDTLQELETSNALNLSMAEMENLVRLVLAYGYNERVELETWTDADNHLIDDEYYYTVFAKACATQALIHEITSGERDKNFNHVASKYDSSIEHYKYCIKSKPTYKNIYNSHIMVAYNEIVSAVLDGISNKNAEGKKQEINGSAIKVDLGKVKLELKSNGNLEGSLTDSRINGHTIASCDIPGANVSINGNTIYVSIPYEKALEYQNSTRSGSMNANENDYYYSDWTPVGEKKDNVYLYSDNITVFHDENNQDVVISGSGVTKHNYTQDYQRTKSPYEYSFTIDVPVIHIHKFFPHKIIPTCTTEGDLCYVCECGVIYTQEIYPATKHDYVNSAWVIGKKATCSQVGEENQICNKCGMVIDSRPVTVSHDDGVWKIVIEATADHKGTMARCCTKCGEVLEQKEFDVHVHQKGYVATLRESSCTQNGLKGTFCKRCNACYDAVKIPSSHSDELIWVTNKQPTCTEDGESVGYCKDCGIKLKTEKIEKTGHKDGTWMTSVEPTCTVKGEEICFCQHCGVAIDTRKTQALGHDNGVWTVRNDPTCEFDGENVLSCTRCGNVFKKEKIKCLGHDDGAWRIDMEATSEHNGIMTLYCTRCGMVKENHEFELHEHKTGYTKILVKESCASDGEKGYVCSVCNVVYKTEVIPSCKHQYSKPFTNSDGTHSVICSVCGFEKRENCVYDSVKNAVSCVSVGYTENTCKVCGYNYCDNYVEPLGHDFCKWSSVEGTSKHVRTCNRPECGVQEFQQHSWGEYIELIDEENTDGDGKVVLTRYCSVCAETQTVRGHEAGIIQAATLAKKFGLFMGEVILFIMKIIVIFGVPAANFAVAVL